MKYFFISDTHGTHPKNVMKALQKSGFENENKEHKLVVAGDITDGLGDDYLLINYLIQIEKQGQLIAIRGNHDDWTILATQINPTTIYEESLKNWLKALPYQIETEHFLLAHGIYLKGLNKEDDYNYESTWASPVLFGSPHKDWWEVDEAVFKKINDKWKTIDEYEKSLSKPLILGHFVCDMVKERLKYINELKLLDLKIEEDKNGLISYGKIHWVDGGVLHPKENKKLGEVIVKVLEFK